MISKNARKVFDLFLLMGMTVFFSSCGQSSNQSNAIPQAQDPNAKPQQKLDVPTTPGVDPRLPDLSKAVSINLTDKTNYTGLKDIAGDISLPLVGDPKISMAYMPSAKKGTVLLAFEDKWGFWGASIPSFDGTGSKTSTAFDMIFSDNELVVRVKGVLNGDSFTNASTIYYRVRKAGEDACKKSTTTCDIIDPGYNWGPFNCPYPQPDTLTPCLQYMNTANPDVKSLGKFEGSYSKWATVPEGN